MLSPTVGKRGGGDGGYADVRVRRSDLGTIYAFAGSFFQVLSVSLGELCAACQVRCGHAIRRDAYSLAPVFLFRENVGQGIREREGD